MPHYAHHSPESGSLSAGHLSAVVVVSSSALESCPERVEEEVHAHVVVLAPLAQASSTPLSLERPPASADVTRSFFHAESCAAGHFELRGPVVGVRTPGRLAELAPDPESNRAL